MEVDPGDSTIVRKVDHGGTRPWGIAITTDGKFFIAANGSSGDVSLIDRVSGKVVRKLNVGKWPWGVASPGGDLA